MRQKRWQRIRNAFKRFQKKLQEILGNTIAFILLIPVYYIGVGIISIIAKLSKKHFLDLTSRTDYNQQQKSFWQEKNCSTKNKELYYKMF